jgi:hypothetical protein
VRQDGKVAETLWVAAETLKQWLMRSVVRFTPRLRVPALFQEEMRHVPEFGVALEINIEKAAALKNSP